MVGGAARTNMLRDVGTVPSTSDPQITALLEGDFSRFDQWKSGREVNGRSKLMRLRMTLDHLLTRLLGARDYAGAAQVLSVLYHRFTLIPSRCVQASLEILRRHPQHHKDELMQFYTAALRNGRLDQVMLYKEMFMLHIVSGDYYEAYHLFKDEMQELDVHHDAHLQGSFGMVCYWLLFIESDELRNKFAQDDASETLSEEEDNDDDDERDGWNPFARSHQARRSRNRFGMVASSATELIESRYMYKNAIGAHILYQEAATALRRAIAVSPESTVFLEFYVQLLTLTGDTNRACDLLEHFYFLNPTDPHAARLLAQFLDAHFPQSSQAQVDIYARWLQSDPSSSEAVASLASLCKRGLLSPEPLLEMLAGALDEVGGDFHTAHSPETAARVWRFFCDVVEGYIDTELKDSGASNALMSLRASRNWWNSTYFSRPATPEQVIAYIAGNEEFHEVVILKAIAAYHLFAEAGLAIGRAIHAVSLKNSSLLSATHLKRFRRAFPAEMANRLLVSPTASVVERVNVKASASAQAPVSVISRSFLVKDTTHAARPNVQVIPVEDEEALVDQALVRALEDAVRDELADGQLDRRQGKRSLETMISTLSSLNGENVVSVPLYVDLIEELLYKKKKASAEHMQVQLKGYLRDAGATLPSWLEAEEAFGFFQGRWITNHVHYGHPGLLLRYEAFLVRYMRKRAKSCQYWVAGVSPTDVHDALHEMKLHVSRSHVHFPEYEEAATWMRIKAPGFIRTRRRLLRDYMLAMRFVAYNGGHVETRDLVYAAMRVAAQNFHSDLLAVEDLQRQATTVLLNRYVFVVRHMWPGYREFLESFVVPGRRYNAVETFGTLTRRYGRRKRTKLGDVQALLWLKQWEAENPGRYQELLEDKDEGDQ